VLTELYRYINEKISLWKAVIKMRHYFETCS